MWTFHIINGFKYTLNSFLKSNHILNKFLQFHAVCNSESTQWPSLYLTFLSRITLRSGPTFSSNDTALAYTSPTKWFQAEYFWLWLPINFPLLLILTYQDVLHVVLQQYGTSPLQISTPLVTCATKWKHIWTWVVNILGVAVQKLYRSVNILYRWN